MKTDSSTHIYPAFRLLLIEDNIADIKLMLEAIKWSGLKNHAEVEYAINAEQAYEMMAAAHAEGNPYKMFTLDLNMPRIDGKEVLTNLKKDNRYAHIPVFIISNSDAMTDITDCEKLGADGYIQKPTEFKRLIDFFTAIKYSIEHSGIVSSDQIQQRYAALKNESGL